LLSPVTKQAFKQENTKPKANDWVATKVAANHMDLGMDTFCFSAILSSRVKWTKYWKTPPSLCLENTG
jgi:hypothetical protein